MPRFFKVLAVQSSQRTLEEMINSILVTKMYSWESFALSKVSSKRRKECALYQNRAMWAGFSMALLRFTPHILVAVTFLTSLMTNQIGTFRASSVFTTLSFANTTILYIRSVGKLELLQILYACFFQTVVRDNPKQKNGRPVWFRVSSSGHRGFRRIIRLFHAKHILHKLYSGNSPVVPSQDFSNWTTFNNPYLDVLNWN